ncbi:hypothetical protein PybrP1_000620, partial [[Pythium] brassicae (nom. inval.)]
MISFGKYKGKTIETVFSSDLNYCKWLFTNEKLLERNPDIKTYLNDKMKDVCFDYTMTWGKHKNKTIQWVYDNDRSYFDWLNDSDYVIQNCSKLKSELVRVRSG